MLELAALAADSATMLSNIPTAIITGFLGAGKTTAIRHLLSSKPEGERWAVLVNEFGETGIDGALLNDAAEGVGIREVPGGCMCCAAGVPMQVALNQLLAQARPRRLLIEPTGLGHPEALIRTLTEAHLAPVLDLRAVITLVDARKLADERYRNHQVFLQQLAVADRIVASKADLYAEADHNRFTEFLNQRSRLRDRPRGISEHGWLDPDWLDAGSRAGRAPPPLARTPDAEAGPPEPEPTLPDAGIRRTFNEGEAHVSAGWRFHRNLVFDRARLESLVRRHPARRIKGILNTDAGRLRINREGDGVDVEPTTSAGESRIEFIADQEQALEGLDAELRACLHA